ncbi:WD40 repeat domain-containing protein [Actinomadura graeca]|uniref:WD40 repeat domain-containing protein n=1 Tax=Actinomadura graeca TaxID=2750812 RepID=A0ABX8R047_9ACTN|nr:WD40 repeat domain-containing protein [Actinomadura graeca]QXJ23634.1 WD40 repeat domain-containing protein [Actinomadura graeca]
MSASRRTVLLSGLALAAGTAAMPASAAPIGPRTGPLPPLLRSRAELASRGAREPGAAPTALPIQADGTTYQMAQALAWLDTGHFAVGRWDGSMSVFAYNPSAVSGPTIDVAVNSPSDQGVQMVAAVGGHLLASSNDDRSFILWKGFRDWASLRPKKIGFDPALGVATSGKTVTVAGQKILCVGHTTGRLTLWTVANGTATLRTTLDLRNPAPVNPWNLHDIRAIEPFGDTTVITGSEDGYLCAIDVRSGKILSQTVFNSDAQRGINDLDVRDDQLLVVNCSVGSKDRNLWLYSLDRTTGRPTLKTSTNLLVDDRRPQAFAFSVVWAAYPQGPCWFVSTEEGALWMGTPDLKVLGYQQVTAPLGSALGWTTNPGRLALVSHDLYEFTTGV